MGRFVVRKIFHFVFLIWLFTTVIFFLLRFLPGGPFDLELYKSKVSLQRLQEYWGLDLPVPLQYFKYLSQILRGDFGLSYANPNEDVFELITHALGNTFVLSSLALMTVLSGSIFLSYFMVRRPGFFGARVLEQILIFFGSFSTYFVAPILVYIFCFRWSVLPLAFLKTPASYILPVFSLSLRPLSQLSRLQAKNWSEMLRQPFIRTALAKGLSRNQIIWHHGFRASFGHLLSWLSPLVVGLYSGSLIVETLFSIPGLGSLFVQSLADRDYPVLVGCAFLFTTTLVLISSFAEVLKRQLDPRLSEDASF